MRARKLTPGGWSLKEHHLKLAREGYVSPPAPAARFKPGKNVSGRKLTDDDVIEARRLAPSVTCKQLALQYGVAYSTMYGAIRGHTFRHLNFEHPPQW